MIVTAVICGAMVMIADAVQTFESGSLHEYEKQAVKLRDAIVDWAKAHFNVDGSNLAKQLGGVVSVSGIIQSLVVFLVDMITGMVRHRTRSRTAHARGPPYTR